LFQGGAAAQINLRDFALVSFHPVFNRR